MIRRQPTPTAACASGLVASHLGARRDRHLSQRHHGRCRMRPSSLGPGTICALVGVNGSGKSTLFKAIMGFVAPAAGEVRIVRAARRARRMKRNLVAYVPQSEDVDWNFPVLVEDVVMMGRYGHMGFPAHAVRTRPATRSTRRWSASA